MIHCNFCKEDVTENYFSYQVCKIPFHYTCCVNKATCNSCFSEISIKEQQDKCFKGQKKHAEKMIPVTKKMLIDSKVGVCMLLNIEEVDRGPADPPNIICVITDIENSVYQVGTSNGIIKSWFSKPDLKKATSAFVTLGQICESKFIPLREAVSLQSLYKGQGYF